MSNSLFFTGLSGLAAAQAALVTTGHNTANVNTAGYSRQSAQLSATVGVFSASVGFLGGGVKVGDISRSYDQYLGSQMNQAQSLNQSLDSYHQQISQIDNLLADPQAAIGPRLQGLFTQVQAVANTPADPAARQQLISASQTLVNQFQSMDQMLSGLNASITEQMTGSVQQINTYASQIASLNQQISRLGSVSGSQAPNDLMDQRDQLVSSLGQLVSTRLVVQDGGQYNVFIGSGQALVLGDRASQLSVVASAADPRRSALAIVNAAGRSLELQDSTLGGGSLGGLMQFRAETLEPTQGALGRLALGLGDAFNQQQRLGLDLQGRMGEDFFALARPEALANANNQGNLQISAVLTDTAALTGGDYLLTATGTNAAPAWSLTRQPGGQSVALVASGNTLSFEGVQLDLGTGQAQPGDSFVLQPTRQGARDLAVLQTDPARIAAAAALRTSATASNTGSARISAGVVDASYRQAPLAAPLSLTYSGGQLTGFPVPAQVSMTLADGQVATGSPFTLAVGQVSVPYVAGATLSFGGVSVSISGQPQNGDSFGVAPNGGGVADGRNALLLGGLQKAKALGNGSSTFNEGYAQIVSSIGNKTRQVQIASAAQTSLTQQIRAVQQSVSGVNQDEETANLLMFQQMYQANAKVIQTASTLFEAVLGISR